MRSGAEESVVSFAPLFFWHIQAIACFAGAFDNRNSYRCASLPGGVP